MPGHVDDSDLEVLPLGAGEGEVGKAELDGDSAFLFLWEAVRIDARESLHESRLSVINVADRSEDEVHLNEKLKESMMGFKP